MLKVLKNLKNSWASVVAIVILLCVQAAADLALPDFTSRIVNVGIQYGGIEEAVPEVISSDTMNDLLIFTEEDNKILDGYDLVRNEATDSQEKAIKKYLGDDFDISNNSVYVLKDLSEEELNELTNIITNPLIEYSSITNEETANQIKESIMQTMNEENKGALANLDIMSILELMPESQRRTVLEKFTNYISQMTDSIKEQAAISAVKQIYATEGVTK